VVTITADSFSVLKGVQMTKEEAIKRAGSAQKLAQILGISHSAISQWEEIPELRMFQLKVLKPSWFRQQKQTQSA